MKLLLLLRKNGLKAISFVNLSLFFDGKNAAAAKTWLDKCYPDSAPSERIVCKWFAEFRSGYTSLEDDECSGRTNVAVNEETIKKQSTKSFLMTVN